MLIYYVRGYDHLNHPFSFIVQANTEEDARILVRDALKKAPIMTSCDAVGYAFGSETDERIVW